MRDLECLREHYMPTLGEWRQRFDDNEEEIVGIVGTETETLELTSCKLKTRDSFEKYGLGHWNGSGQ